MIERLEQINSRYNEIKELLSSNEIINDIKRTTELSKELSAIEQIVNTYQKYKKILSSIQDAKEVINDVELGEIAKEQINDLEKEKKEIEEEIEILLIPKDPNDEKNVIIEIRGAAGGDEANIFAGDLY